MKGKRRHLGTFFTHAEKTWYNSLSRIFSLKEFLFMPHEEDKLRDACGIFGIYDKDGYDVARMTYAGLFALQHRGQESCGIAVNDNRKITHHRGLGHVGDVFNDTELDSLKGQMAIGHVRYSTCDDKGLHNAQPLVSMYIKGQLAIAHNGKLSNYVALKKQLELSGAIFQTITDAEIMLHILARERMITGRAETALASIMKKLEGAYSIVMMTPQKLIACRDPLGMRPLCLGKMNNTYVIASESCALDTINATYIRDVDPGEIIIVDKNGLRTIRDNVIDRNDARLCIFEFIYFARSDSVIENMSVHEARKNTGAILAEVAPVDADMVIGVPDSGIDAAIGYATRSGIPYGKGLVINRYVGRTFIRATQSERVSAVQLKINVLKETIQGKRIIMIDDSIVRGTTSANLVAMLRDAGAKEVHMRISSPMFLNPCYYGIDIPSSDELFARKYSREEMRDIIGADSLEFFPVERLKDIVPQLDCGYCDACFTGNYPWRVPEDYCE
jgi:amidophosphoribosyltransferase